MLVRSRRAVALALGTALIALATACTNPTAPSATSHQALGGMSGDGVTVGGGTHTASTSGVTVGGGT
ncbi:MAG TPA: hypothetical protein VFA43_18030 [Gemmatimonadaceae bacterium]|nr:hypothetical protein [Gemmatimonadaceae bacterium]